MKIVYTLIVIGVIGSILVWSNKRDEEVRAAYERYEDCVQDEYNSTLHHWYAEHGTLPACDITNY